jgi:hypothetical protein
VAEAIAKGAAQVDVPAGGELAPALRVQATRLEWADLLMVVLSRLEG